MRKLAPEKVYLGPADVRSQTAVVIDGTGLVLAIDDAYAHDPASLERLDGILVPGYVNAHCHLELSHMKGTVPTGTGLTSFIRQVVSQREAHPDVIQQAVAQADAEMQAEGIVAVGDISNVVDSFATKEQSPILYYTFVELFDFLQNEQAEDTFRRLQPIYQAAPHQDGHRRSYVPHAPYSVSPRLFQLINAANTSRSTISIHNQETPGENELFERGTGDFVDLYRGFGINMESFRPINKPSVYHLLSHLDPRHRWLLAHNTLTTPSDIRAVLSTNPDTFWVTNPNANLYIENRLPTYQHFIDAGAKVCVGTDSLTSNWQLSIFAEMKTIAKYQSSVPLELLIEWATTNGACALGLDDRFGRIKPGRKPGLNLITLNSKGLIDDSSRSRRIV